MQEILERFKTENDILLGACGAQRMDWLVPELLEAKTPFVSRDIERRINPRAIMPQAESIIVIGVAGCAAPEPPEDASMRGRIAGIGAGKDYHRTVKALLTELAMILSREKSFEYKIFTDAGHLNERALAVQAGLGFIGKNRSVISEKFGSFFNIGYMLTDLALSQNKGVLPGVMPSLCGSCNRCIDVCPGKALENGFNPCKCVSYLTQKKGPPTEDEAKIMGKWLYGCDICQDVCQFNVNVRRSSIEGAYPLLADCVDISDEEFMRRYSESSLFWRGGEIFRRNVKIAKGQF